MKIFYRNHNQILTDIIKEFDTVEDMKDADVVLLWNEVLPDTLNLIEIAKKMGKKVITYQHGRRGSSRYFPPISAKIVSDKLLVWGELDKVRLVEVGNPADKIEVVGTTIWDHLQPRKEHEGTNIVFCPDHWSKEIQENIDVRYELRKMNDVKVITKLIDTQDPIFYDNPIQSDVKKLDHFDICADVLREADLVVAVADGTFTLMAQALDIPVVVMDGWEPKEWSGDPRYKNVPRVISSAAKRTSLRDLQKTIRHQLKNPQELSGERKQICIDEGGINLDPIYEIKKTLATL